MRRYTCTVCNETMEETIAKLGAVQRISGSNRVKTALSVAAALKDTLGVEKFEAVVIAAGDNEKFADALAGSYLAVVNKAPILLYTASGMSDLNVQFIQENLSENGTIYLLGGVNSIPDTAMENLTGYEVKRIAGSSRYSTNLAILEETGVGNKEILVATGKSFADSLSISAAGLPILLVDGSKAELRTEQIEFLQGLKGNKVTIIGGKNSVSEEMEATIEALIGADVERISGNSRQMTSVEFAKAYFENPDLALITYSDNFPDGLAGGPLAHAMGAPLLLTKEGKEAVISAYIAENSISSGYVLGGTSSISDATARLVFGLSEDAVISTK